MWKHITQEHNFITTTSFALLTVAMEADAVMRQTGDQIKTQGYGPKDQRFDIQSRAIKADVNAMRHLKVLPR